MKKIIFLIAAFFLTSPIVYADFVSGQAQKAVDDFNSLNKGQGYVYRVSPFNGTWSMTTSSGYDQADFGAYSLKVAGDTFANTCCVEPIVGTGATHVGKLNYENNATTTTSGKALTLGSALLYSQFATGTLDGYNYESPNYDNGYVLTKAIQYLMGATYDTNWSNAFLSDLLEINSDKSYWTQIYDPGQYYDEIGDYSVFVMNNKDEYGTHVQDFLYLAAHEDTSGAGNAGTPEPASMLIFGAGLSGLALSFSLRKRLAKKN